MILFTHFYLLLLLLLFLLFIFGAALWQCSGRVILFG